MWKHELTLAKARRQKDLSKKAEESYRADRLRKRYGKRESVTMNQPMRCRCVALRRSRGKSVTGVTPQDRNPVRSELEDQHTTFTTGE